MPSPPSDPAASPRPPASLALPARPTLAEFRGLVRLAVEGVLGASRIAQGLHGAIGSLAPPLSRGDERRATGLSGRIYGAVRGTSRLVGHGADLALSLVPSGPEPATASHAEGWLAALSAVNGVLGDHLARSGNPLALPMGFDTPPQAGPDVLVLVHGLCMNDRQWTRGGHDHGELLRQRLGWSPVYLRYNTGRHVSENAAELAWRLDELLATWPVTVRRLAIVGHSMGGLVARSAVHQAQAQGRGWPDRLHRLVFLGTPHHGAVLERGGNLVQTLLEGSPYLKPFARLARLRSDGITDLRHGNLLAQDWAEDPYGQRDRRQHVPLPQGVACHAVAGTLSAGAATAVIGDGLVSVDSALGRHRLRSRHLRLPRSHTWVAPGVGHLGLLGSDAVGAKLLQWFQAP